MGMFRSALSKGSADPREKPLERLFPYSRNEHLNVIKFLGKTLASVLRVQKVAWNWERCAHLESQHWEAKAARSQVQAQPRNLVT